MYAHLRRRLLQSLATLAVIGTSGAAHGQGCEATGSSPDLPTIEELERQGAKVGQIEVQVEDIFDTTRPG